jgi:uncharacterized protein
MSDLPFLNMARQGKNNWWRYLVTSLLSLVVASVLAGILLLLALLVIGIFLAIYDHNFYANLRNSIPQLMSVSSNPLFFLFLVGISYAFSFLLFYICIRFLHKRSFSSVITSNENINFKRMMKGALLWLFILGIFSIPSLILYPGEYTLTFNPQKFGFLLILSLIVFPIQASFEEVFFRGYLMQGVGLISKRPIIPLLVTSLIFGAFHFFNATELNLQVSIVISTFFLGLMLGIIVLGENGIETAMGVHIANNLFVALLFNSKDSGLGDLPSLITTPETEPLSTVIFTIVAALILITVLFWNKKENLVRIFKS